MAGVSPLYEQWFRLADADKDNVIAGGEAVIFFMRSGLPQSVLGQVWELASGGGAYLNRMQFATAMRLCSLAQASGGVLQLDQARAVMSGVGPALPPPRLQGLEQAAASAAASAPQPSYVPQMTGGAPSTYVPQVTGAPTGYAPQITGAGYAPQVTGGYVPQVTGAPPGYIPQMTGGPAASSAGGFPPATPADLQRYGASFQQLDTTREGSVKGADCFGYFMQWGLDKGVLRDIWSLVAGDAGQLNREQFIKCLYLMDCAKKGLPVPARLPPGPFPPTAAPPGGQPWSLQSQYGASAAPQQPILPPTPAMPERIHFGADSFTPAARDMHVPVPNAALLASLAFDEKRKLEDEAKVAAERAARQKEAEDEAARARAKLAAYNAALSEITVFKSRADVGLLTATDTAERLNREVAQVVASYDKAYAAAAIQNEAGRKVRERVMGLMAQKAEAEERMRGLTADLATADAMSPGDVTRLEAEVALMEAEIAQRQALLDAKRAQSDSIHQQKEALLRRAAELSAAAADADAELDVLRRDVTQLQAEAQAAKAAGDVSGLGPLLSKAAATYRTAYSLAQSSRISIPADAQLSQLGLSVWVDDVLAGAATWEDDDEDARGYVLVNAAPGTRVPRPPKLNSITPVLTMPTATAVTSPTPPAATPTSAAAAGAAAAAPPSATTASFGEEVDAFGEPSAFGTISPPTGPPPAPSATSASLGGSSATFTAAAAASAPFTSPPSAAFDRFYSATSVTAGSAANLAARSLQSITPRTSKAQPSESLPSPVTKAVSPDSTTHSAAVSPPTAATGFDDGDDPFAAPPEPTFSGAGGSNSVVVDAQSPADPKPTALVEAFEDDNPFAESKAPAAVETGFDDNAF